MLFSNSIIFKNFKAFHTTLYKNSSKLGSHGGKAAFPLATFSANETEVSGKTLGFQAETNILLLFGLVFSVSINLDNLVNFFTVPIGAIGVRKPDLSYEAFDSALELAPDYDYAFLNRGIALYYGKRPELAVQDLGRILSSQT